MLKALCILFLGTIASAALITPWIYELLQSLFGENPWPFSRVFDRVAMVCAVLFIVALRRNFPIKEAFAAFRGVRKATAFRLLFLGCAFTLGSVAMSVPFLVHYTGDLLWQPDSLQVFQEKALKILVGAFLISFIEEAFFRVLLLKKLQERLPTVAAVILASILYAGVHFIAPIKTWSYDEFHWAAGLQYVQQVANQFFHPTVPPAFFGLFLVGMALSWVILRFRSVWLCVGMHAGWVIGVKSVRLFGDFNPVLNLPSGRISQYFLVSLPIAWASILLAVLLVYGTHIIFRNAYQSERGKCCSERTSL